MYYRSARFIDGKVIIVISDEKYEKITCCICGSDETYIKEWLKGG